MENKLIYQTPPANWNEALPIGNGKLGAMLFGNGDTDRIQLNEDSIWSSGPKERVNVLAKENYKVVRKLLAEKKYPEAEKMAAKTLFPTYPHMAHYQTGGDVWIKYENKNNNEKIVLDDMGIPRTAIETKYDTYQRSLNIEEGIWNTSYTINQKKRAIEAFCSYEKNAIFYTIAGEKESCEIRYTRKENRRGLASSYISSVDVVDHKIIAKGHNGDFQSGIEFCVVIEVSCKNGTLTNNGGSIFVTDATEILLVITIETSFRNAQPELKCLENITNSHGNSFATMKKKHVKRMRELMNRTTAAFSTGNYTDIPTDIRQEMFRENEDGGFYELYFNYGKYLSICSSFGDSLPSTLQGIWNQDFSPAWGSRYTLNINTELNYSFVEKVGLHECLLPLLEHLKRMQPHGRTVATKMYGLNGMVAHHNTDIWGDCAPQDHNLQATIWPLGSAWLALFIWISYQHTREKQVLVDYYSILKENAVFMASFVFQNEKGYYEIGPSVSPENKFLYENSSFSLNNTAQVNVQIVYDLFKSFIEVAKIVNKDHDLVAQVSAILADMQPLVIDGKVQEWSDSAKTSEPGHRHISQLYPLFPGIFFDEQVEDKQNQLALKKTLEERVAFGSGGTGWSTALIALYWERLTNKEKSVAAISTLLKEHTYTNLLDKHPPFQIEGNFGGALAILQLFVQDYSEGVLLFPDNLISKVGQVHHFYSKHGVKVSFAWQEAHLTWLRIESDCAAKICVKYQEGAHQIEKTVTLTWSEAEKQFCYNA